MISRIRIINLILAALSVFFCVKAYDAVKGKDINIPGQRRSGHASVKFEIPDTRPKFLPESAYNVIADLNLFSPDRTVYVKAEEENVKDVPEIKVAKVSGRKLVLYGIILGGSIKKALINNPVRKSDESRFRWIEPDDVIGGLKVVDIKKDSVIFSDKGKKIKVVLYDKKNARKRELIKKESKPTIVTTAPGKKAGSPPKPKASKTGPVKKRRDFVNPFETRPRKN